MATLPTASDLAAWTAAELDQMRVTLVQEQERRRIIADAPVLVEQINAQVLVAQGRTAGLAWVQPTGGHDAYPRTWKVVKDGYEWESLVPGNVWAPSDSVPTLWKKGAKATAGTAPAAPAWEVGKAYKVGDRVAYQGVTYVVVQAHTSQAHWTPSAVASLYSKE